MANQSNKFKVLIIGGGNCGLAIATGLKKAGIDYTVFERDDAYEFEHKIRDWGMLLHWGTEHLEAILPAHLKDRIREPQVDPNTNVWAPTPYVNGKTGELIGEVPTKIISRVSRRKLRRFFTKGENLNIEYDKRLSSVSTDEAAGTVHVTFTDGTSATGNHLIGADGSRSVVREFLLGSALAQPQTTGLTLINFSGAKYTAEQALAARASKSLTQLCFHPDIPGTSLLAALDCESNDPSQWKMQNYTCWWGPPYATDLKDPKIRLDFYRQHMSRICDPFRSAALAGIETDDQVINGSASSSGTSEEITEAKGYDHAFIPVYSGQQWPPVTEDSTDDGIKWDNHNGLVTLAGDAAHSMLPDRGQGLNNAMADARLLVDAIVSAVVEKTATLSEAVTAYEDEMRPRGAKEVKLTYQQAVASRDFSTIANSPIFRVGHAKQ